ncbi:Stem 28 kDa glycoprotein [Platanthera zijinensis]|uniref:Stem 28 kDa glycoprotein n=1 Tax=Platanthera zijinensis TaxID=2320716 RepID=A0AAP0BHB2_9ASPA
MNLLPLLFLLPALLGLVPPMQVSAAPARQIHLLRPVMGSAGAAVKVKGVSCSSWQFGVETNSLRGWNTVPAGCESYFGHYMMGRRYREDSRAVAAAAAEYARGLQISSGGGKQIWVFDVDETSLSNLPYYSRHGFGVEPFNATLFDTWVATGTAPPLPESLKLYKELLSLGIKVVFLTGRAEEQRQITASNLKKAGYYSWEKLILRGNGALAHENALQFKSSERLKLTEQGYRIVGNIGDQWSDILGSPEGERTFKLPDPLYYIS